MKAELQRKETYKGQYCELNGHAAIIMPDIEGFAEVRQLKTGLSCQWSWSAVERIMKFKEGKFKSY